MSSIGKKKLSGAENRKRKRLLEKEDAKQRKVMEKLLVKNQVSLSNTDQTCSTEKVDNPDNFLDTRVENNLVEKNVCIPIPIQTIPIELSRYDLSDPAKWPTLENKVIQLIIEKGPKQLTSTDYNFPKINCRKFNCKYYFRTLPNGISIRREWLTYSMSKDCAFCFCCKLFSKSKNHSLNSTGFSDWNHLPRLLREHENSFHHMNCYKQWKDFEKGLKTTSTIDCELQKQMSKEVQHWREVLKRLVIFVQYLGTQNLAFRGTSDVLHKSDNGNFLQLVEAISKFDFVLQEHLRRIENDETQTTYMSKDIQNELIGILSNSIKNKILKSIKKSKYYSVILDCTPDISHTEQMTLVFRIVHDTGTEYEVREFFLEFLNPIETTGEGLTDLLLNELAKLEIPLEDCRGQGYDNGSNMKGKISGVQARIRNIEPRAFFTPCAAHSLNLVVSDSVGCSTIALSFFGIVESLYVFFSASTHRWAVLKKNIETLTLKHLSNTRWESRVEALKPLSKNLGEIHEALVELSEHGDALSRHTAVSLGNKIAKYDFICCSLIWLEILEKINFASKYLQTSNICLVTAVNMLESTKASLEFLRNESSFSEFLYKAKIIAEDLEIESNFHPNSESLKLRSRRRKNQFNYEKGEETVLDPTSKFKVEFYYKILDQAINSIRERFEQLKSHVDIFQFLYNLQPCADDTSLDQSCKILQEALTNGHQSDINASELFSEIKMLLITLPHP